MSRFQERGCEVVAKFEDVLRMERAAADLVEGALAGDAEAREQLDDLLRKISVANQSAKSLVERYAFALRREGAQISPKPLRRM